MTIDEQDSCETLWEKLKTSSFVPAKKMLPVKNRTAKKPWISDETLQLIEEKKNAPQDSVRYKGLTLCAIKSDVKADRRRHFDEIGDRIEEANRKRNHTQIFCSLDKRANSRKPTPYMVGVKGANRAVVCDDQKVLARVVE